MVQPVSLSCQISKIDDDGNPVETCVADPEIDLNDGIPDAPPYRRPQAPAAPLRVAVCV